MFGVKMNQKCFQYNLTKVEVQKPDFINGNDDLVIKTDDEAEKVIDVLLSNWKTTTKEFLKNLSISCKRQNLWPWAIALYEKELNLAGHVVSIRQKKEDFSFGAYSLELGQLSVNDNVPPFSFLLVNKKMALADAAIKSLLFEQSWNLLKDKDESLHWICLPSAPPDEWVKKTSEGDDELFLRAIRRAPPIFPVSTVETPRKVLAEDFKSLGGELPIGGGWGYTKDDACIIDKNDPTVDPTVPFDGVGLEYIFVEKRIYEEMIILRPKGEKFSSIKWDLQKQCPLYENGKYFDRLIYKITAFPENDWEELKVEFEGPQGQGHPDFDKEAHERKRQDKIVRLTREFWFDITSFYGQGLVIPDKSTGKKKLLQPESFKFTDKFKKLFDID